MSSFTTKTIGVVREVLAPGLTLMIKPPLRAQVRSLFEAAAQMVDPTGCTI
jgi:hypothetical protein